MYAWWVALPLDSPFVLFFLILPFTSVNILYTVIRNIFRLGPKLSFYIFICSRIWWNLVTLQIAFFLFYFDLSVQSENLNWICRNTGSLLELEHKTHIYTISAQPSTICLLWVLSNRSHSVTVLQHFQYVALWSLHSPMRPAQNSDIRATHEWKLSTTQACASDIWEYTNLFHQVLCAMAHRWAAINQRGNCEVVCN